jgi:hypothetical protein
MLGVIKRKAVECLHSLIKRNLMLTKVLFGLSVIPLESHT